MIKKKTYMINHTHPTSVTKGKYHIDKICTKLVDQKMLKNLMKKIKLYNISKHQNSKSQ